MKKHESHGFSSNKKNENDARGKVPEYMIRTNMNDVLFKEEKSQKIASITPVEVKKDSDYSSNSFLDDTPIAVKK